MKIYRFLWLLLLAVSSFAQTHTEMTLEDVQTATGAKNFSQINKVIYVDQQAGATADAKFAAACALLPSSGGTLDARGFSSTTQTIAATVNCGNASKEVTFIGDQSTTYVPASAALDMFQVNPGNSFRDIYMNSNGLSYTGSAFKFANNIYDNKQSTLTQLTGLINIRCDFGILATGTCVLLQSDDTNYVTYVSILHLRCSQGQYCIYLHATGSGTGTWITDGHFEDVVCAAGQQCYAWIADKGNIEGNLCIHCTSEFTGGGGGAPNGVNSIVMTNNVTAGVFEGNMFYEFAAYDYAANTIVITAKGATTGVTRSDIRGRWDGSCSGDCGQATPADTQYNSLLNLRFANSGVAQSIGSFGGVWINPHSGNGLDLNLTDFGNRLWMHGINGAGINTNSCDVGQRCLEFGSSTIGIAGVAQMNGNGSWRAGGTGVGGLVGGYIQQGAGGGGAFLTIPAAGSNVVSDSATQTLTGKTYSGALLGDSTTGGALRASNNVAVLNADFTTANASGFQTITGLGFTLAASLAQNVPFTCDLMYSQATVVSDSFGIQDVTVAPTRIDAGGTMGTSTTASTFGNLVNLTTTTATAIVTATPTVTTVNNVHLSGVIQQPSNASTSAVNIMVSQSTAANVIVVKAGSMCRIW